jgi:hypothetical protein
MQPTYLDNDVFFALRRICTGFPVFRESIPDHDVLDGQFQFEWSLVCEFALLLVSLRTGRLSIQTKGQV